MDLKTYHKIRLIFDSYRHVKDQEWFYYETPHRTACMLDLLGRDERKTIEGEDDDQPSKFSFLFELSSLNNLVLIFFTGPPSNFH